MKIAGVILSCVLVATSCGSSKPIFGTYQSNFTVNGFHFQQIILKADSTLEYKYWGHMIWDTAVARYNLVGNQLILQYYPVYVDTSGWQRLRKMGVTLMEEEYARMGKSAPAGLILQRDKLVLFDTSLGIIKKKPNRNGRRKKYFLIKI